MIYPVLTDFEWGIAGIISIIILFFGIRSIVREGREPEIKKDDELSKEKFYRYCEEETRKIKEFEAKFEKEWYGESTM